MSSSLERRERGDRYYVEILLVSFAALLLEISYTRVVSFKLFYYYTYLVIGLALLGIGAGGVLVAISDRVRRAAAIGGVVGVALAIAVVAPSVLPQQRLDASKLDLQHTKVLYSSWSPIFRIDVVPSDKSLVLYHDGLAGSVIEQWDGTRAGL